MSRKKIVAYGILLVLLAVLAYGLNFGLKYAYIGSSYAAKTVCSCEFVSKRDSASIRAQDLYAVPFATVEVDRTAKTVSATVYGLARVTALYREGLGCTLLNEITAEELRKQPGIPASNVPAELSKLPKSLFAEVNQPALQQVIDAAFAEKDPAHPIRTRAVVVVYKGEFIAEKYAPGFSAQTPLLGWSMTKSVTNAMVGMLVKDSKLDIQKPAPIDEWKADARQKITLDALLRMSSGLAFEENYAKPGDATYMLFRAKGAGAYALTSKATAAPNEVWSYSSGTTNILQEVMRRQFASLAEYRAFPHQRLFQKIGMTSAVLEPDASGTYVGSSFMYATARDWATFGQLYLQDGVWQGERLLPEGWVKYSSTETPHSGGLYAAQFWIDHADKTFPQDAFMALGFEGQSVTIIPSKQLVIVRLGCTPNEDDFNRSAFVKSVLATVSNR
ncbi:MAG: class C beta-lactamase-related serine hydrolase [Cytophagaceae bacterium]|nr:MAG: class C beta-lactamase-related serine hydrolase [Cytophagaceae bacterium]